MPHGIIFILDILHGFNAYIEMLPDVTILSDSDVFMPSEIMGLSDIKSKAPVGIRLANPTVKIVAVSMSTASARVLIKYSLKFSSNSHTRRLVVYTTPV